MLTNARLAFDLARKFCPQWAHRLRRVDRDGSCIVEDASGRLWLARAQWVNAGEKTYTLSGLMAGCDGQYEVRRSMLVPVYGPVDPAPDAMSLSDRVRASLMMEAA